MHERMDLTVILVSHSMEDVAKLADRILVMNGGRVEMFGTPAQVFSYGDRLTQIGLNVPQITRITDELRKRGLPLSEGTHTMNDAVYQLSAILKGGAENA